jgi:hypothetical protein
MMSLFPGDAPAVCPRRCVNLASFRANGTKNLHIEAEKHLAGGGHVNGRLCTGHRFIAHNAFLAWMR